MMKQHVEELIQTAVTALQSANDLPDVSTDIQVEGTRDKQHGDFATNVALMLAKPARRKPREIADLIIKTLPESNYVDKVEVAGPGFINFFLSPEALTVIVPTILEQAEHFGESQVGEGKRVLVEFVSSNPTGPLHVGHGRHAAFGAVVCNLLHAIGYDVYREYYVNDAGRQMDILAVSLWLRYLSLWDDTLYFPSNAYRGAYVKKMADALKHSHGDAFNVESAAIFKDLPDDEPQGGDKEIYIDAVIGRAKALLGEQYVTVFDFALNEILMDIKSDLADFGVTFDHWFSERELVQSNVVTHLLEILKENGHTYEQDGALWFKATAFGDEKDRVLVRKNGVHTYFTNDVAYHLSKFERGTDVAIDIFGSDHHGYVPRMRAAMEASGIDKERLVYLFGQFVTLYRGGEQVQMSTRGGEFVTLRELRDEVGNDAARFFYVMRKYDNHIDFDLDLAKSKSNENPVYYVQYAYARICSVFRQLQERQRSFNVANGVKHLALLTTPEERDILNTLSKYPDMIMKGAMQYEPHLLTNYLRDLASHFHAYYNSSHFIVDDQNVCDARLSLVSAVKQVLINGFKLLGISAPEAM